MDKPNKIIKKITSLPGYKIIIVVLFLGLLLMTLGKYLPGDKKTITEENGSASYTEQEKKLAGILSQMDGVGEVEVFIQTKDKTSSVLILTTGADDPVVNIRIRQAVRTIMQTDNENIKIVKKQSN